MRKCVSCSSIAQILHNDVNLGDTRVPILHIEWKGILEKLDVISSRRVCNGPLNTWRMPGRPRRICADLALSRCHSVEACCRETFG